MAQIRVRYVYRADDRPALLTQFGWVKKITPRSIVVQPDFEDCLLVFSTKLFRTKHKNPRMLISTAIRMIQYWLEENQGKTFVDEEDGVVKNWF